MNLVEIKKQCITCEYYYKEHCVNRDSDMCTCYVTKDYSCEWWEVTHDRE